MSSSFALTLGEVCGLLGSRYFVALGPLQPAGQHLLSHPHFLAAAHSNLQILAALKIPTASPEAQRGWLARTAWKETPSTQTLYLQAY